MPNRALNYKTISATCLLIAVVMMITAAIMTYFFVLRIDPKVMALKMEVQEKQSLIHDIWNNIGRRESKIDTVILLGLLQNKDPEQTKKVQKFYLNEYPEIENTTKTEDILKIIDKTNKADINYIDNLYLEQVGLQNQINNFERNQKQFANLAFLLQIISLILIIIRRDVFT